MADKLTHAAVMGTHNASTTLADKELLQELGIRGMRRLAGFNPSFSLEPMPEPAPLEDKPMCDERTIKQFLWLIDMNFNGLRALWIRKFLDTGQRLPDELLPTLMDKHRSRFGIPTFIHQSVGERAKWLANLPDSERWQWYRHTPSTDGRPSRFGSRFGRHAEYRELRFDNAALALDWLRNNWDEMNTTDRLSILSIMRDTLSYDDLPFLKEQVETLHEVHQAETLQEIWYIISILEPEMLRETVDEFIDFVHLRFDGKRQLPVLDLRWSNSFINDSQYVRQGSIRKLAVKQLWWENLSHLIRLVPLNRWLEKWDSDVETLLNGARQGLQGDVFLPTWVQRAMDEEHEAFSLGILRHQRPQINRFGWHMTTQSRLLENLSFDCLQSLLDDVWMNPDEAITWLIP